MSLYGVCYCLFVSDLDGGGFVGNNENSNKEN